jgi:hypothetical protein
VRENFRITPCKPVVSAAISQGTENATSRMRGFLSQAFFDSVRHGRRATRSKFMKQVFFLTLILGAVLFAGVPATKADDHKHGKQTAQVNFEQQYRLKGVLLFGEYLVVHDDDLKARGEDCVFFYRTKSDGTKALVVSYHCEAVKRAKADSFKVIATRRQTPWSVAEITEIQFAGTTDGHRVP